MDEQKKWLYDMMVDAVNDSLRKYSLITISERLEMITDYLLANGVIAPPCKVGDTVWILRLKDEITKGNVYAIECNRDSRYPLWLGIEYGDKIEGICCYNVRADMIGKTVFLTREEAEAALK